MDARSALPLVLVLVAGCRLPPPTDRCRTDGDCGGDRVCESGKCRDALMDLGPGSCTGGRPEGTAYLDYDSHRPGAFGTKDCPVRMMKDALALVAGGGQVLVRGNSGTGTGSRSLPANV